jgi:hypothetical protein
VCGICGQKFGQSAHLKKHQAKHSAIDHDLAIIRAATKDEPEDDDEEVGSMLINLMT